MDNNKIGNFIASVRKEKNLTQKELGDKLFVTDKAVSKWERGLSLPDITLLSKLSEILDVEIIDILDGKKETTRKMNVEDEIAKIKEEMNKRNKQKSKRIIVSIILLLFIIVYLIFRNIYLGYGMKEVEYSHSKRNINIGIPKMSFMIKNNDRSYSFKNLRNSNIIENEVKRYLKTLEYSTCNNTVYYYDKKQNFSIIHYSVKNHLLYSTTSYEIVERDYCFTEKMSLYTKKLNGLKKMYTLNGDIGKFPLDDDQKFTPRLHIIFLDNIDMEKQEFTATLKIEYLTPVQNEGKIVNRKEIENSSGSYEIKKDKLYYYRTDISKRADDINIPEVSVFKIEDGSLRLVDTYLSAYEKNVVLK